MNKDTQKYCNCYHMHPLNYMLLTYLIMLVTSLLIDVYFLIHYVKSYTMNKRLRS